MFNLYPDELVYSACARYSDRVRYCAYRHVVGDLFGDSSLVVLSDFPVGLAALVDQAALASKYSVERVLDEHTLLPFFAPFLPTDFVADLRAMMATTKDARLFSRLLSLAQRVCYPETFRFCTVCLSNDRRHYGEGYWHRTHQLPGIEVCPDHAVWLTHSSVPWRIMPVRKDLVSLEQALRHHRRRHVSHKRDLRTLFLHMAQDAAWLVHHPLPLIDQEMLRRRYICLLAERGLATYNGRVREGEFLTAFFQRFPSGFLQHFHLPIIGPQRPNPLLRLMRHYPRPQHPLHHLLLLQFLAIPIDVFWQFPSSQPPFGDGPWPCLNPKAVHYQQPVITQCQITTQNREGRPEGTFTCDCGYVYQRRGPDWGPMAQFTRDKVVHVSRQQKPQTTQVTKRHRADVIQKRHAWIQIVTNSSDSTALAAKKQAPKLYRWLYEHDRPWLLTHRPTYRPRDTGNHAARWEDKDQTTVGIVQSSRQMLAQVPGTPIRISRTAILREARRSIPIANNLRKLPRTAALLEQIEETRDQFIGRRVAWALRELRQEGHAITHRQLIVRMGLGFRIYYHPAVMAALYEKKTVPCVLYASLGC